MKKSSSIALAACMAAGVLSLRTCDDHNCQASDQTSCSSSSSGGGVHFGGGGGGNGAHAVETGGFGSSAGGHAGSGGE